MDIIKIEKAVAPGPNISIWSADPLLGNSQTQYYGRVFVEVWDNQSGMMMIGRKDGLLQRALAAFQDRYKAVRATNTPWTDESVAGEVPNQVFLGRVVIEIWEDQAVVAFTGTEAKMMDQAIKMLRANLGS